MRGHTYQRGRTWSYVVDTDPGPDGRRRQTTKGGFPSEREARRALNKVLVALAENSFTEPSRETLRAFIERWLPSVKARVRPSTWAQYATLAQKHIVPGLGDGPIQKLTPDGINAFYAGLLEQGRLHGRGGLSPRTVGHIHGVLRNALNDAVKWRVIGRNPALEASPPRKQQQPLVTWAAPEARDFLAHVRGDRLFAAYALALTTGMRRGELLGLAWRDVELEAGWLHVRQTLVSVNYRVQFSTPKTQAGRRSIAIDPGTVEILREHRLRQLKERHELGLGAAQPDDLVFAGIGGQPLNPSLFTDGFDRRVKTAGVPRIRFHDVRHTAATLALAAGVPAKVVAERLGHSSVSITLDLYTHSVPTLQEEAAVRLAALVLQPVSEPPLANR